jgi:hypothetical protein
MKASLSSRQKELEAREQEMRQRLDFDRQQFEMEYRVFETDRRDLAHRYQMLHREEAILKTERLKLEEKQREIETMHSVFKNEELNLQVKYDQISRMRDDAGKLSILLTNLVAERAEAKHLKEETKHLRKKVENEKANCDAEKQRLETAKRNYIDQRLAKSVELQNVLMTPVFMKPFQNLQAVESESTPKSVPKSFNTVSQETKIPEIVEGGSVWSAAERDLAAQLELQLDRYLTSFSHGYGNDKIRKQKFILEKIIGH